MSEVSLKRQLTLIDTISIFVGIIVGSGIFIAPAIICRATSSLWLSASLWLIGGVISACGAFCYAECGVRIPRDGGFYLYYKETLGESVAFVTGW
ncbi:MAG: amino acid permease, partial [Oligoflexales bacterium]|nr:amino acid permease [Oligoflexales bacterium]